MEAAKTDAQRSESTKHLTKKKQIISSAIKVMQDIGYEETSVRAICDAANISIGAFYHYFQDKTELLTMILGQVDIYLTEEVKPQLTADSDLENIKSFVLGFARETAYTSHLYGGVLSSPKIPLPNTADKLVTEKSRPLYTIPTEIVLHGQATGEFNKKYSADEIVDKLITCLRGCSMDWARRNYSYDIENYVSVLIDMLFVAFCN